MKTLFPSKIPVIGHTRIAIYDFDNHDYKIYSKDRLLIDSSNNEPSLSEKGKEILRKDGLLLEPLLLDRKDIGRVNYYEWDSPSIITNAIIEISHENGLTENDNLEKVLTVFEGLGCQHFVIRVVNVISLDYLKILFEILNSNNSHSLQLFLPYNKELYTNEFGDIIFSNNKIAFVIVEDSPFNKNIENKIYFTPDVLKMASIRRESQFSINISLFSESQLYHTYFNRKLFVSRKGEIKNAPECDESFGLIQTISGLESIRKIIDRPSFRRYWKVNKDSCQICSCCEFKHMCVDNRVPIENEEGIWSHQEECDYNPLIGKWKDEIG